MQKLIEYKGFKFVITIDLDVKVEKRIDGKRWHEIRITNLNESFYQAIKKIENPYLEASLDIMIEHVESFVDGKLNSPAKSETVILLEKLGFK